MQQKPFKTFIIYARKDEAYKNELLSHLRPLIRSKLIEVWHDGDICPGEEWDKLIKNNLEESELILILVSVHCLDSDYIYDQELAQAFVNVTSRNAKIITIILSPCAWQLDPVLSGMQGLPKGMLPVNKWPNKDDAWLNVVEDLAQTVKKIVEERAEAERIVREKQEAEEKSRREKEQLKINEARLIAKKTEKRLFKVMKELNVGSDTLVEYLHKHGHTEVKDDLNTKISKEQYEFLLKQFTPDKLQKLKSEDKTPKEDPFYGEMILVKGGTFQMGSNKSRDEQPIHSVTLNSFYIGKHPVTQKQWKAIMGDNPSAFKGDDLPVERVSWNDIQEFLKKLNAKYPGKNYRLPTEAEWEYAARGGNLSKGYEYSGSDTIDEVAWYWENSGDKRLSGEWDYNKLMANRCQTHPVGQKKPNELGIYDMSGNVFEWCEDTWHDNYNGAPKDGSAWVDNKSSLRVHRGGSWSGGERFCRIAHRLTYSPGTGGISLGFRLIASSSFS